MSLPKSPRKHILLNWKKEELQDRLRNLKKQGKQKKEIEAIERLLSMLK